MVPDAYVHVQIAGRPAPPAARTTARQAQRRPMVDSRRHLDHKRPLLPPPALSPAIGAGRGDLLTDAAASGARGGGDHLTQDGLPDPPDLARPVADAAGDRGRPGPGAGAGAGRAGLGQPHGQLVLNAEDGLGELQRHGRLGILPAPGTGPGHARIAAHTGAAAGPEEGVEEVADTAAAEAGERIARPPGRTGRARPADAGRAEHVVLAPALGVAEGLIGQVDLLEPLLGAGSPPGWHQGATREPDGGRRA